MVSLCVNMAVFLKFTAVRILSRCRLFLKRFSHIWWHGKHWAILRFSPPSPNQLTLTMTKQRQRPRYFYCSHRRNNRSSRGIICKLILLVSSLVFEHPATTHLRVILQVEVLLYSLFRTTFFHLSLYKQFHVWPMCRHFRLLPRFRCGLGDFARDVWKL